MQLRDRTLIISGGASGLGGATTDMVVAAGGRAVILDINDATGRDRAARHGAAVRFIRTDVTSDGAVEAAVAEAVAQFGRIDGLVNAAGIAVAERVLPKEGPQPL